MKPILIAAVSIVHLALLCYTVGTVLQHRTRRAGPAVVGWLTAGVLFDVVATGCMIAGTERSLFTLHGWLGYSALAAMLVDTIRVGRHRLAHGAAEIPRRLQLYSRYAYLWWLIAYLTGALLVALAKRG